MRADLAAGTPLLDALFALAPAAGERIAAQDPDGFVRRYAEHLLEDARPYPIDGLEKLASDAGNACKFRNLLAELRFAIAFAKLGADVELLRDRQFGSDHYTPDLLVGFPSGLRVLVEVTRFSEGSPDVTSALRTAIDGSGLPFRVTYVLGETMSVPTPNAARRTENEALITPVVAKAIEALHVAHASDLHEGAIHVTRAGNRLRVEIGPVQPDRLPFPEDMQLRSCEEWLCAVHFEPSPLDHGYLSGGVTLARIVNMQVHQEKLLHELRCKTVKRVNLPDAYTRLPFLVAIANDEVDLDPIVVLSALTGSRCAAYRSSAARPHRFPATVEAAREAWASLFVEWDYVPSAALQLTDFGAYLDERDQWSRDVSGVLVAHHGGATLQWLPNPFATINDPRLVHIGFSLDKLGAVTEART